MNVFVTVKPNSRVEKIVEIDATHLNIWTNELPIEGRVNEDIAGKLAKHFKVAKSQVVLLRGAKSRNKVYKINK